MTKYASIHALVLSDHTAALNPDLLKPTKQTKTEARKDLERELRESFARQFETVWQRCNGPALRKEFKFCEERDWHNDYLHEPTRIIIELDGGVWNGGRHVRPQGFIDDCVKLNMATMHGYGVIRIPTGFATDNYLSQIIKFLQNAQEGQAQAEEERRRAAWLADAEAAPVEDQRTETGAALSVRVPAPEATEAETAAWQNVLDDVRLGLPNPRALDGVRLVRVANDTWFVQADSWVQARLGHKLERALRTVQAGAQLQWMEEEG